MGWLVVAAVSGELAPLREVMVATAPRMHLGWATFDRGTIAGEAIGLLRCGVGKVNAAMATAEAIVAYGPHALLTIGSAGALTPELTPGDVILGEQVVQHDVGYVRGEAFVPTGVVVYEVGGRGRQQTHFVADGVLLARAERAARAAGLAVRRGLVATGDIVVMSAAHKQRLVERFGATVVEMESGAIAQVAQAHGVPWVAIRAVSDTADESVVAVVGSTLDATDGPAQAIPAEQAEAAARLRAGIALANRAVAAVALATIRGA